MAEAVQSMGNLTTLSRCAETREEGANGGQKTHSSS